MFLDYSSWSEHVSDASVVDFVSEFDKKMRTCMPADKGNKARFLQAVVKGREMTDMTGSVQCDGSGVSARLRSQQLRLSGGAALTLGTRIVQLVPNG